MKERSLGVYPDVANDSLDMQPYKRFTYSSNRGTTGRYFATAIDTIDVYGFVPNFIYLNFIIFSYI